MIRFLFTIIFIFFILFVSWWGVLLWLFIIRLFGFLFCYRPIGVPLISINFGIDRLSWTLIMLRVWVRAISLLASHKVYLTGSKKFFLALVLLLLFSLVFSFLSCELLIFYFFFEGRLIPILLIILLWGYQPERLQAGLYIIIYTLCGSLPLLIRILMIYLNNGHTRFFLLMKPVVLGSRLQGLWFLMMIIAFLVKLPLYGVHLWLPKAHVEAPVAGSMILAGVLLKLGVYGLFRIVSICPMIINRWGWFIIPFSLLGSVITRFLCIRQTDFKSLIAYSSVAHIGILAGGLFSYSVWGWQGALLIRVAHGLRSSALFIIANIIYSTCWSRSVFIVKGLQNLFPFMAFWWFIFCARNMAAPPFLNLLREIMLITRLIAKRLIRIWFLLALRFLRATYSLLLFVSVQHGPINSLINPLLYMPSISFFGLFLHFFPLVLLTFNPIIFIFL